MTRLDDAISVIKQSEEVIMTQKKIIIELLFKEECILKKIKDIEIFLKIEIFQGHRDFSKNMNKNTPV